MAQTVSDKGMGLDNNANEVLTIPKLIMYILKLKAADNLVDMIREDAAGVTLVLAELCGSIGTLRATTIRTELRKSLTRRNLHGTVLSWAKDFKIKDGELY